MAYTTINDPSAHFQAFTYTGNGANRTITLPGNSDLKFDLYWYKQRSQTGHHRVFDTSRGLSLELYPDLTAADSSATYFNNQQANSFDIIAHDSATNTGNVTFANWQWKANGGTTASNTDGSVTSTVQANTTAGFSIVTFTSASSGVFSVGHGLGVLPAMIIVKNREATSQWRVWHKDLTNLVTSVVSLNRTDGIENYSEFWGAGVTSSVFGSKTGMSVDASDSYLAYCFAEKQGYSKFGKYVGNGNASGPFVYLGFKPAFVMIKEITGAGSSWAIFDNKRSDATGANVIDKEIAANENSAEYDRTAANTDFLSNGFKIRNTDGWHNTSGDSYAFMAFAENPFVTSKGVPSTAR